MFRYHRLTRLTQVIRENFMWKLFCIGDPASIILTLKYNLPLFVTNFKKLYKLQNLSKFDNRYQFYCEGNNQNTTRSLNHFIVTRHLWHRGYLLSGIYWIQSLTLYINRLAISCRELRKWEAIAFTVSRGSSRAQREKHVLYQLCNL